MWAPAKKKKLFVRPFSPPVCVCVLSLAAVFALPEQQFSLTPLLPISSMATVVVHGRDQRRGEAMVGKRMEKLQGGRTDRASAAATMRT